MRKGWEKYFDGKCGDCSIWEKQNEICSLDSLRRKKYKNFNDCPYVKPIKIK